MKAYYFIFAVTMLLCAVIPANDDKQYKIKLAVVFFPVFLFGALRVNFGLDYSGYESIFNSVRRIGIDPYAHEEIGYQWLNLIMPSWRSVLVLTSLCMYIGYIIFFYQLIPKEKLWLGLVFIFFAGNITFFFILCAMRNGLALSVLMMCTPLILKRKWIWFIPIGLLMTTIHSSTWFFYPIAYLMGYPKLYSKKELMRLLLYFGFGLIGLTYILSPIIMNYLQRYEWATEGDFTDIQAGPLAIISSIVMIVLLVITFANNQDVLNEKDSAIGRLAYVFCIGPLMGSVGGARFNAFFGIYFMAFIVIAATKISRNLVRASLVIVGLVMTLYSFYYVWQWNNPYFAYEHYESLIGTF